MMKTRFSKKALSCGICYGTIEVRGKVNSCDHEFCAECIERWAKTQNTCPICVKRFFLIKKINQRVFYRERKEEQEEIRIENKDQNKVYISVAEYLIRMGLLQARDFILVRYQ